MSGFRSILVAADFSDSSRQAFHAACALAREDKTRIFVLHVLDPRSAEQGQGIEPAAHALAPTAENGLREAVKERLRREYAPSHPVDAEYRVAAGAPADAILRTSDELGCDLIVLGTHGRTALRRLLAGSVAETVLRHGRCPVLVLRTTGRPATRETRAEEATGLGIGCILHPTDFSAASEPALRVARNLARDQGARLVLLHVIPVEVFPSEVPPMPIDLAPYRTELGMRQAQLEGPDLKGSVESILREGDVADQVLQTAAEVHCDLIVMGTHGRSGVGRVLMGSAAEAVLRRSRCPVLAVRNPPVSV